jgi:hypothetical protein
MPPRKRVAAVQRVPPAAPVADVRSRLVQGNVWLINAGFVNVAAQIGPEGVFVVDTGTEAMGEKILGRDQAASPATSRSASSSTRMRIPITSAATW